MSEAEAKSSHCKVVVNTIWHKGLACGDVNVLKFKMRCVCEACEGWIRRTEGFEFHFGVPYRS